MDMLGSWDPAFCPLYRGCPLLEVILLIEVDCPLLRGLSSVGVSFIHTIALGNRDTRLLVCHESIFIEGFYCCPC